MQTICQTLFVSQSIEDWFNLRHYTFSLAVPASTIVGAIRAFVLLIAAFLSDASAIFFLTLQGIFLGVFCDSHFLFSGITQAFTGDYS